MDIMIDLETLSLSPRAAIIEIGALGFGLVRPTHQQPYFQVDVDGYSCLPSEGSVDPGTVDWHKKQPGGMPPGGRGEGVPIYYALQQLSAFIKSVSSKDGVTVWANGSQFDIVVLEYHYKALGESPPWLYSEVRDARTVYKLAKDMGWRWPNEANQGTKHRALDDCRNQVVALKSAWEYITRGK